MQCQEAIDAAAAGEVVGVDVRFSRTRLILAAMTVRLRRSPAYVDELPVQSAVGERPSASPAGRMAAVSAVHAALAP
jgi:hypothetical protein